jgi:hypothetical protein
MHSDVTVDDVTVDDVTSSSNRHSANSLMCTNATALQGATLSQPLLLPGDAQAATSTGDHVLRARITTTSGLQFVSGGVNTGTLAVGTTAGATADNARALHDSTGAMNAGVAMQVCTTCTFSR